MRYHWSHILYRLTGNQAAAVLVINKSPKFMKFKAARFQNSSQKIELKQEKSADYFLDQLF